MNERYDPYADSYYESGYEDQAGRSGRPGPRGNGSMPADRGGSGPHFYDPNAMPRGRGNLPDIEDDEDFDDEPSNWRRRAAMIAIGGGATPPIGGGGDARAQVFGKGSHPRAHPAPAGGPAGTPRPGDGDQKQKPQKSSGRPGHPQKT